MKYARILSMTAMAGVLFTLVATAQAQQTKQGVATVVRIKGEARYSLGDGNWHPLVVGKILSAGAILQTAHDAWVDMVLGKTIEMPQAAPVPDRIGLAPDALERGMVDYKPAAEQNMVRMTSDCTLAIDKLTVSDTGLEAVSDTELNLTHGRIYCTVKKLTASSKYLVKIPNGIAGVRGTVFGIGADGWCACWVNSLLLSFLDANGNPSVIVISAGNMFNPQTGQSTPLPPDLVSLFTQIYDALRTTYVEVVSFEFDGTRCYISPTRGTPPWWNHHHGGGGGGGGGGF